MKTMISLSFLLLLCACGGSGGGAPSSGPTVSAPEVDPPGSFSSATFIGREESDRLFGVKIEFVNYLPESIHLTELLVTVDTDESGTENLGDFAISLAEVRDCQNEQCSIASISRDMELRFPEIGGDTRSSSFEYIVNNDNGHTSVELYVYQFVPLNVTNALEDNSVAVRVEAIVYDGFGEGAEGEGRAVVSRDVFPSESGYESFIDLDTGYDDQADSEGDASTDISSVQVYIF